MAIPYYDLAQRADVQTLIASLVTSDDEGCMLWQGEVSKNGYARLLYGQYSVHGLSVSQLLWCAKFGMDVPEGVWLYGMCVNLHCVSPDHHLTYTKGYNSLIGRMRRDGSLPSCVVNGTLVRISKRLRLPKVVMGPSRMKRARIERPTENARLAVPEGWPTHIAPYEEFRRINGTYDKDRTPEEAEILRQVVAYCDGQKGVA